MKPTPIKPLLLSLFAAVSLPSLLQAEVIISADFSARTVSGSTASNIAWTTTGITTPTDLVASVSLVDKTATAEFFTGNSNVGNGGSWSTSFDFDVTGDPVMLTDLVLTHNVFSGSATAD